MKTIKTFLCLAFSCMLLSISSTVSVANTITTGTITPLTYCPGDSVMVPFTCTGTFTGGNVFTAQLSNDTGQFSPPVTIGTLTSTTAGTIHCMIPANSFPNVRYRIRVKSSAPSVIGSTSIDSFTVYNNNFVVSIAAFSTTTFCSGDSVVIWNVTGGSFTAYQWYRNSVAITGATSDHYAATLTGLYTLKLSTPCATFTSGSGVVVTVNQSPNMTVSGDTSICIGDNSVLQASGAYSYTWSPSNTLNQSNTQTVVAHPTIQTTYTVTGTAINSCTSTASILVHVSQLPAVHAYTAQDTICLGASVLLTATGCDIYSWSPINTLNTFLGDSVIATPTSSTWYLVVGKNLACTPTAEDSVRVTVVPATGVTVTGNDTICNGTSTVLTASGANNYTWSPGISLNDSTLAVVTASPTTTTVYFITGINSGCNGLDSFKVNVKPSPTITITGADTICINNSTTLTAGGAVSFIWSPYVGLIDSVNASEVANPTSTTTYIVTGLGTNGCYGTGTFTLNVSACLGVNDLSDNNSIVIFPNPAADNIAIDFNIQGETVSTLSIMDARGSLVYSKAIANGKLSKATIDLSTQPKGIYILQINTDKSSYRKKIVIE